MSFMFSLLNTHTLFAAHKLAEYQSSYYRTFYDIYADSTVENVYVFIHANNDSYLAAIVLSGKEEIDDFANKLESMLSFWDNGIKLKGKIEQVGVRFSVNSEWHNSLQTLSIRQTDKHIFFFTKRLKDGKVKQHKANLAFTKDELKDFIGILRRCYHYKDTESYLPQDQNIIISY